MASETVDPIDWSHPRPYTGQYPLSSTYCRLQSGLQITRLSALSESRTCDLLIARPTHCLCGHSGYKSPQPKASPDSLGTNRGCTRMFTSKSIYRFTKSQQKSHKFSNYESQIATSLARQFKFHYTLLFFRYATSLFTGALSINSDFNVKLFTFDENTSITKKTSTIQYG